MLNVYEFQAFGHKSIIVSNGRKQVLITEGAIDKGQFRIANGEGPSFAKLIHTIKDAVVLEEGKVYHVEDIIPRPGMIVKQVATGQLYIYQTTDMNGAGYHQSKDTWINVVERFMHPQLPGTKYKILDLGD